MLLQCMERGCFYSDEHLLDLSTNEVICTKCGKPLNVPDTTKRLLKSMHQVKKQVKTGLQITCKSCKYVDKPLLKKNDKGRLIASCRSCGKDLEMYHSFIVAMKEMGEEYAQESEVDGGDGDKAESTGA